jgi:ParB family chromosome partitioning protein
MNIHYEHTPAQPVRFHEYAELFPWLEGAALEALRDDIRLHGVREPIVMLDGAILDGRNRYMCARDLGIEYPVREFDGDDPLAFVISHNLHRRHLTESQRASVAARLANMERGGDRKTQPDQNANLQFDIPLSQQASARAPVTNADAAKMLNVSERSVATARKVQDTAPPEIVRAVDRGQISVSLAAQVADLPEASQAEIIAAPPEKVKEVAREEVKKAHVAQNSGNNEWYTPAVFIEAARAVMGGIDLDPASSEVANRTVKASRIFTAQDDGLAQDWPIGRIWMNPPYAQPLMGQFAQRLADEARRGSEAIVLVNNATETAWFQVMGAECAAICFPKTRIKFIDPDGNASGAPLQGQAIIYCGSDPEGFERHFAQFGMVVWHG